MTTTAILSRGFPDVLRRRLIALTIQGSEDRAQVRGAGLGFPLTLFMCSGSVLVEKTDL
jgi:hypothetical protein